MRYVRVEGWEGEVCEDVWGCGRMRYKEICISLGVCICVVLCACVWVMGGVGGIHVYLGGIHAFVCMV